VLEVDSQGQSDYHLSDEPMTQDYAEYVGQGMVLKGIVGKGMWKSRVVGR